MTIELFHPHNIFHCQGKTMIPKLANLLESNMANARTSDGLTERNELLTKDRVRVRTKVKQGKCTEQVASADQLLRWKKYLLLICEQFSIVTASETWSAYLFKATDDAVVESYAKMLEQEKYVAAATRLRSLKSRFDKREGDKEKENEGLCVVRGFVSMLSSHVLKQQEKFVLFVARDRYVWAAVAWWYTWFSWQR